MVALAICRRLWPTKLARAKRWFYWWTPHGRPLERYPILVVGAVDGVGNPKIAIEVAQILMGVVHRLGAGLDVLGASVPSAGLSLDGSPSIALPAVAGFREHSVADSGERRSF